MSGTPSDPTSDAPPPGRVHRDLAQALQRARTAIAWERAWPALARTLTLAGLFLALSWAGLWINLPTFARGFGVLLFALLAVAALLPLTRFRWPSRAEGLQRLDRNAGIAHRPATAITDTLASTDPVTQALWRAQRARTLGALKRIRAGLPSPKLSLHDPWALRALSVLLLVATFVAAGEDRMARVAAAFDWNGAFTATPVRVDAWINPPAYTNRAPVILSAADGRAAQALGGGAITVPAGSTLVTRASGSKLDVAVSGGITEAAAEQAPQGTTERHFTIAGDGTAKIKSPSGQPEWSFKATPDRAPTIALAKEPERQAKGALLLSYQLDDDYGVTQAEAHFAPRGATQKESAAAQPLYDPPQITLGLPNARTRSGVGQTVKDLSEHPFAGTDVTLTLIARDEAGNEGRSAPSEMKLPERLFTKPLARALIEQRRTLALDANRKPLVMIALEALLIVPAYFTPEAGQYLGLHSVARQLGRANSKEALRETVDSLWNLAVSIEDGDISDAQKALQAAQEALKQALENGASDEEIKKLTDNLRAALDNFMRQLAEQLRNNPQQLARPLDPNAKVMRQQDLKSMIDRMERLSRSGNKDAARQLLDQMQQMMEGLQMAQPGQGGDDDGEQALAELGDIIRKQQQLRDKTFRQGQDSRRDRNRGQQGDQNAMNDLQQDQQGLRNRLQKLLEDLKKKGMMPGQQNEPGDDAQQGGGGGGDPLGEADSAMGDADGRLGQGRSDSAVDAQGRALESMRKGAQSLAQQQGDGEGEGAGNRVGRQQNTGNDSDPLGRPLRGREYSDDLTVKIPGEIDVQRARRILEELRRRFADPQRPQIELDYIERLLKDY